MQKMLLIGALALSLPVSSFANQLAFPECASDHKVNYLLSKANDYYEQGNYKFAYICLRHSASQNDADSQFYIASFYQNGLPGVITQDLYEAGYWMNTAAFNGSKDAINHIKKQKEELAKILGSL